MTVRTVSRRGKRRLVIDILYRNADRTWSRYRHDAEVQTMVAARAEDRRRLALLAGTGSPTGVLPAAITNTTSAATMSSASSNHKKQSVTFTSAAELFKSLYLPTRLKPSTRRGYTIVLDGLLTRKFGKVDLLEIDAAAVRMLDRDLVRDGARPSTRRNIQCVLRAVRRFAVEQGLVEFDELPRFPPLPRVGVTVRGILSEAELDRIEQNAEPQYRLPFALTRYAGLRASEVRGLRWGDVDLVKGRLIVHRARCRDEEAPPKSGHERLIPLHGILRELLQAAEPGPSKSYVTGPKPGKPWTEFALSKAFNRACTKAEVSGFRYHDMRHFFVTSLFRSGAPAPVVQKLAGHEHLITTQRYAHATLDELEESMRRLTGNRLVTGQNGPQTEVSETEE